MTLPDNSFAITVLNYGKDSASVQVDLTQIPPGIPAMQVAGQTPKTLSRIKATGTVGSDGKLSSRPRRLGWQNACGSTARSLRRSSVSTASGATHPLTQIQVIAWAQLAVGAQDMMNFWALFFLVNTAVKGAARLGSE